MEKKSGLATAGMVLGIIGICLSFIPIINNAAFFLGLLATIFGIISLVKKSSKGKAIAALVLGVLAIVITLVLQDSWGKELDNVSKELDKTSQELNKVTGDATEEVLKNDVQVTLGKLEISQDEYGLTDSKLVVTVKNITKEKKSYSIHIEAVDSNGQRIQDDYVTVNDLGAGQQTEEKIFEYIEDEKIDAMKNATFNIVEASTY